MKPKYIDHEYCQILLIGERLETGVEPTKKDQKHDKETPQEELEKLEHEDELRVEHLHGKSHASIGSGYLQCARVCNCSPGNTLLKSNPYHRNDHLLTRDQATTQSSTT